MSLHLEHIEWLTNDPEIADQLKRVDRLYDEARAEAAGLPLAEKVEAYREAKAKRDAHRNLIFALASAP